MNQERFSHCTTIVGGSIYVVGGSDPIAFKDSIEQLNVAANALEWIIFQVPGLSIRGQSIVAPLSDTEILVAGGQSGMQMRADALVINLADKSSRLLIERYNFAFVCQNQAAASPITEGEVYALAWDGRKMMHAMRYSSETRQLQSFNCFMKW